MPVYVAEPVLPYPPMAVSVGSFFDRFGPDKLTVLADPTPLVQALIKDVSVRRWIDLARPDVEAGIDMLINMGHTSLDKDAILSSDIREDERP